MKTYIGSKLVKAKPMDKYSFLRLTGKEVEANRENAHGYLVEYPDGYQGWNIAPEFERVSRAITNYEYRSFFGVDPDDNLDDNSFQWYIQTKVVNAESMDRKEYYKNHIQGENDDNMPESENEKGYKVIYPNGYESWSPAIKFEEAYREVNGFESDLVIKALNQNQSSG